MSTALSRTVLVVVVLLGVGIGWFALTAPDAPTGSGDAAAAAFLREQLTESNTPTAAYAVVRDGEVTVRGAVGDGVSPDSPFLIGSLSKSFTALAVTQLADAGKIDLDAPVTRYLPWFRTADPAAVITVTHLLDQTSGLPTSAGTDDLTTPDVSLEDRVRAVAQVEPTARPGTKFQYCNKNYATLGLIVQVVSGQDYGSYVDENILTPLDMRHSHTDLAEARADGLVDGSSVWFGTNLGRRTDAFPGALPDGYLVSTANDLTHYVRAQLDGTYQGKRIVSPQGLQRMHAANTPVGDDAPLLDATGYGFGWGVGTVNGHAVVSHDGDLATYHANLALLPDEHTGLIVLTGRNGVLFDPADAYSGALSILAGRPAEAPGRSFLITYALIDVLTVAAIVAMVVATVRQVRRLRTHRYRKVLPGALNVVASAAAYAAVFVPLGLSMGSAVPMPVDVAFGSAPDITVVVVGVIGFLSLRGIAYLAGGVLRR